MSLKIEEVSWQNVHCIGKTLCYDAVPVRVYSGHNKGSEYVDIEIRDGSDALISVRTPKMLFPSEQQ